VSRNVFVVLEGIDGSGKTSVRRHLFTRLRAMGHDVLSIQGYYWLVPEHTKVIVDARFHGGRYPVSRVTEAYVGDKEALSTELLAPHLDQRSVVCDRFVISDVVTQVMTWGADIDRTYRRYLDSGIRRPDVILFLDTPPDVSISRLRSRGLPTYPWEKHDRLCRAYDLFVDLLFTGRPEFAPVVRIPNTTALTAVVEASLNAVLDRLPAAAPR
jgi:dTMP kinase